MSFFENFRIALAKRKISRLGNVRNVRFFNLSEIKSINILYYLNEPLDIDAREKYKAVIAIIDDLRDRKIKCEFTFFADNSLIEMKRVNMTALTKQDFSSFNYCPKDKCYTNFMMDDSQVLINLSPVTCWQLEYLAQYSKSQLKIALQREEQGAKYDFLFKPDNADADSFEVYKQILQYLDTINK